MKIAEIKVSYKNTNHEKVKIDKSEIAYNLAIRHWDLDIIEYQEEVKLILLNRANTVLGIYDLSKGGITGTVMDVRVVLSVALKCNSTGLLLIHNHPSGNLKPSEADILITKKIKDASKLLDITLLDHLIISKDGYYSFTDEGIL